MGLLISFVIMTALIVLLIGCGTFFRSGAKIQCYLCKNMVVYDSWDDHKKDCLRVYERHIKALPKLKVSTQEGHCLTLIKFYNYYVQYTDYAETFVISTFFCRFHVKYAEIRN